MPDNLKFGGKKNTHFSHFISKSCRQQIAGMLPKYENDTLK